METLINKLRDKANQVLYSFAKLLGEDFKRPPVSRVAQQKARESISIDLPFFRTLLPYETIDENLIFINKNSAGFGLQLAVAAGADESLAKTMVEMIKNKLAPNIDLTVMLYKHHHINDSLAKSYDPIIARGDIYAELAKQSLNFHKNAALHGYKNLRNVSTQLADYIPIQLEGTGFIV